MAKNKPGAVEIECPCCEATLKIDPEVRAVISHKAKERPHSIADLGVGLQKLKEQESQRDALFNKQVEQMKSQKDVLARKFDELLKQAKEDPNQGPPPKLFDLD